MTSPLDEPCPPRFQQTSRVVANDRVATDTFRLRMASPEIGRSIRPGQFVMVRAADGRGPFLARPFALYDIHRDGPAGDVAGFDVVYLVGGPGTLALSKLAPGDFVEVWGPLGNGFGPRPAGTAVLVAGGIGQTPFLALGRWWTGRETYGEGPPDPSPPIPPPSLLYGVRSGAYAAGLDEFERSGFAVEMATDDGSLGHRGFVTDLLAARLDRGDRPDLIVACGPPGMLAAVARIAGSRGVRCDVSLENHMACGFGVCFSCVAPIRQDDGSTDLRRVCVEGPIFDGAKVDWPAPR